MGVVRLTAHLASPLVVSDDLHLDGLLASAHPSCRETPLARSSSLQHLVLPPLPLAAASYRGHQAWLGTVAIFPPHVRTAVEHTTRRRDGADVDALAKPLHLGLGPGKNRMYALPAIVTPSVSWVGIGLRRSILRLAARISRIGSWRSAGYGVVTQWTAEYLPDSDASTVLVAAGRAQRHLPAAWVEHALVTAGPYRPPYWHPARQTETIVRAGELVVLPADLLSLVDALASPEACRAHKARHAARRDARRVAAQQVVT